MHFSASSIDGHARVRRKCLSENHSSVRYHSIGLKVCERQQRRRHISANCAEANTACNRAYNVHLIAQKCLN